jgi:hypothetical protein
MRKKIKPVQSFNAKDDDFVRNQGRKLQRVAIILKGVGFSVRMFRIIHEDTYKFYDLKTEKIEDYGIVEMNELNEDDCTEVREFLEARDCKVLKVIVIEYEETRKSTGVVLRISSIKESI